MHQFFIEIAKTCKMNKPVALYVSFLLSFIHLGSCVTSEEDGKNFLTPFLNKKYELAASDENFDKVLETLGLSSWKRSLAQIAQPSIELNRLDDGRYTLTTNTVFNQIVTKFRLDEEFDDESPDGREVRTMFVQDKNLLLQIERGDKTLYVLHEFSADEVRVTLTVDRISSVRIYKLKK